MTNETEKPKQIPVCQLDSDGYFIGVTVADLSREDGTYLIPGGCVDAPAPSIPDGNRARWTGTKFAFETIPVPPAPEPPPPPTQEQIIAAFSAQIQGRLDAFARGRNYDGILSACTYATSTMAKFKAEGQACVNLRDATWSAAYNILAQVQAGTRPMPSSIADIEADLPPLVWPS